MPRLSDKRERLLDAAKDLIHQQGYGKTTLADISAASGVPLGNVYYYFKTKEDIATAVIAQRETGLRDLLDEWSETYADPRQRLLAFLDYLDSQREGIAAHGCPIGSLCQELDKARTHLASQVDQILQMQLEWVAKQFNGMRAGGARSLAEQFIVELYGTTLLANATNDPKVVSHQVTRLKTWIEQI